MWNGLTIVGNAPIEHMRPVHTPRTAMRPLMDRHALVKAVVVLITGRTGRMLLHALIERRNIILIPITNTVTPDAGVPVRVPIVSVRTAVIGAHATILVGIEVIAPGARPMGIVGNALELRPRVMVTRETAGRVPNTTIVELIPMVIERAPWITEIDAGPEIGIVVRIRAASDIGRGRSVGHARV